MTAPNDDLNSQIAFAKGWLRDEKPWFRTKPGAIPHYDRWLGEDLIEKEITHWINPEGKPAMRPNYVGTLAGLAGLMRELGPEWDWGWDGMKRWCCWHGFDYRFADIFFFSPADRPGDCVGEAYLSEIRKEAAADV